MRRDLRQTIQSLREGKVSERKKAIEELSRWFQVPQNPAKIGANNDDWIEIFEALAISANTEHEGTGKKASSATAIWTRIENISAVFRAIVEYSIPYLNNASVEFLVPRLIIIMKMESATVDTTGSNYAKALLSVVSHPPHVRSFTDKMWHMVSRLSWAVLLNDSLSSKNNWPEVDPKQEARPTDSKPTSTGMWSQKMCCTGLLPRVFSKGATLSPVQNIFATILRHLCTSPFAPIIERARRQEVAEFADQTNWACYLLVKFCRYFETFQSTVASHLDMIPALCHVLSQVELNRIADMMWFSRRIWPRLVALMKGRVRTDYVLVLVVFKYILPYYVRVDSDDARSEAISNIIDSNSFRGLTDLVQIIDEYAPMKSGIETLSMDALRLEFTPVDEDVRTAFRAKTFRHGRAFTASQAHAWAILELQADSIFYVSRIEMIASWSNAIFSSTVKKRPPHRPNSPAVALLPSEDDQKTL